MYKRILTAAAAAIIAVLLLFVLGPMGVDAVSNPQFHTVAQVR